jgi:hypothetical protein
MSKKLIAVASAAALALAGLVAIPTVATANPGPFQVTATGWETTNTAGRSGGTAAGAIQVFVPSNDVLRSVNTAADAVPAGSSTALRLAVRTPGATDAITVTATGGVEVLSSTQWTATTAPTTATGTQSLTVNAANGLADIYAYTTSTTAGTVVLSAAGSSQTIHIQGLSPLTNMYKLAFTGPSSAAISGTIAITGTVRDMFDNILRPAAANLEVKTLGGTLPGTAVTPLTDYAVAAATGVISFTVPSSTTASAIAVSVAPATANPAATAVTAFPGRAASSFFTVNAVNLAAQVTALEAQVAALRADYNALAERWNKRVASKKAPKKAVTLK